MVMAVVGSLWAIRIVFLDVLSEAQAAQANAEAAQAEAEDAIVAAQANAEAAQAAQAEAQAAQAEAEDAVNVAYADEGCMTTGRAQGATGVNVQRLGNELCAWVWRSAGEASVGAMCPQGFICTFDVKNQGTTVYDGPADAEIVAGTWRQKSGYTPDDAVWTPCDLLAKEQAFGASEDPAFDVTAGNFACEVTLAAQEESTASAPPPSDNQNEPLDDEVIDCPMFGNRSTTYKEAADGSWLCKLKFNQELGVETAPVPTGWKVLYWNGEAAVWAEEGNSITTSDASFYLAD
jgi:hypothetical protein